MFQIIRRGYFGAAGNRLAPLGCGLLLLALSYPAAGLAQLGLGGSNQVPDPSYYLLFGDYYQGDLRSAARDFAATRGAVRWGSDRYLDSACYWTMAGECHFHAGSFPQAIELYETALDLYLTFTANGWHQRIQVPPLITARNAAVAAAQITWGQSQRNFSVAGQPDTFQVLFGRLDNERVAQQGGVIQNPEFRPVDVAEIMRCVSVAMHRRRMIKGVTCRFDPFSSKLVEVLEPLRGGDGTILGAWNGIALGIAYAGVEEFDKAQRILLQSLQFGGGMDHSLTPLGLLELAIIKFQLGELAEAATLAAEASYSAALYRQYDVLDESLSLGTTIHLIQTRSPYPPLENAIAWLNRDRARLAQTSLTIRLAECFSEAGEPNVSAQLLSDAAQSAARIGGPLQGRIEYLSALNSFLNGDFDAGRTRLAEGLARFQSGSRWLYQLGLADNLTLNKKITDRQSDALYGMLLRDPLDNEWRMEPIEAMSFLASDHLAPIERWFSIAVANQEFEHAIEIAELLRRHRFFATMPLAGRQLSFRWLMHGPEETVGKPVLAQRTDFLTRYPAYKQLCDQSEMLQQKLLAGRLLTDPDTDERREQTSTFLELMTVSQRQEATLASFALRREPASMTFPPAIIASTVRNEIAADQLILYVVEAADSVYFLTIDLQGAKLLSWQPRKRVIQDINQLYREAHLAERQLDAEMLQDEKWKATAYKVAATWLPQLDLSPLGTGSELLVIPDGVMWYAPWELLRFGTDEPSAKSLFDLAALRYSPTLGLAISPQRTHKPWTRTAVFSGPLANKFEVEWTQARVEDYQKLSPEIIAIPERLDFPSNLFNTILDQVVVWSESEGIEKSGPYGLVPVEKDRGKNGSNLAAWMSLPFTGAEHVVLPTFSGLGDLGIKGKADGHEFFVIACAMLSSGTRTVLLSRWNVAGESVLEVSRGYLDNVAEDFSPAQAWHQAAAELQTKPLDWSRELRLKPTKSPPELTGRHPVFWAGYMVFDVPTQHIFRRPDGSLEEGAAGDDSAEEGVTGEGVTGKGGETDPAQASEPGTAVPAEEPPMKRPPAVGGSQGAGSTESPASDVPKPAENEKSPSPPKKKTGL